jgi:hypothetical protein
MIRPVTEIACSIAVAVDDFPGDRAEQVFVDTCLANQATSGAVGVVAAVVELAGGKPAIGHGQGAAAMPAGLVGQLGSDQTHRGIRHRTPESPAAHALFHRGHVEVLDDDVAIGARQPAAELMGCFPS